MGCKCKSAKYAQNVAKNYGVKPTPNTQIGGEIEQRVNNKFKLDSQGVLILLLFPLLFVFIIIPFSLYGLYKALNKKSDKKIDIYKFLRKKINARN